MLDKKAYKASAQMLIRKPAEVVFQAFINPEITKTFWFTKGSGPLEVNKKVTWTWEMYNFSAEVKATEINPFSKIAFNWYGNGNATKVELDFKSLGDNATFVTTSHFGFAETGDELTAVLLDSTSGFTIVLAGLKAYLEHGILLNLIGDKFPKELTSH